EVDERLASIRSNGEVTAAMMMTADRDTPEWSQLMATRATENQALRDDLDLIEKQQGEALIDDVGELSTTVDDSRRSVLVGGLTAFGVVAVGTVLFATRAARREREETVLAAEREQISRRNALDAKLQAALDMTETEDQAVSVVQRALAEALPGRAGELLLA